VSLSEEDRRGLDRLLDFYRTIPADRGCTTVEEITLTWRIPGEPERIEHYIDDSCSASDREDRLTLWGLIRRTSE